MPSPQFAAIRAINKSQNKSQKAQRRRRKKAEAQATRLEQNYKCGCCGKGEAEDNVQIALTRRWGLACADCINDGSMSEMVGEDITAYKIEDVPRDYRQRRR